VFRVQGLMLWD